MSAIHHITEPLSEVERNDRVYRGEILVFSGFAAVEALVEALRARCRRYLGDDPERAHEHMTEGELSNAASALRQEIMTDSTILRDLRVALESVGVDSERTYGDGLVQRVQSARCNKSSRMLSGFEAHRDTWGSNIPAQTNWWGPTFPTTPERTIALYPTWFERAIPNDSEGWDLRELFRRMKAQGAEPYYPLLPLARQPPDSSDALPISLAPGELMCFSGAHLHSSVPNATDRTRLSFETRTIWEPDATNGRGAPNVDGRAPRIAWNLFRRLKDGQRLGSMK